MVVATPALAPGALTPAALTPGGLTPGGLTSGPLTRAVQPPHTAHRHIACAPGYANFALGTMYAHRLWIKLWMSLGHPAENLCQRGGNAAVTRRGSAAAHSPAVVRTQAGHSACARAQRPLAARTGVIPRIHRPYDDYQSSYARQINIQVAPLAPCLATRPYGTDVGGTVVGGTVVSSTAIRSGACASQTRRPAQTSSLMATQPDKEGDR